MDMFSISGLGPSASAASTRRIGPSLASPGTTGPSEAKSASLAASPSIPMSAADEFLEYMKMTPAERLQDSWLRAHGISKEEFDAMSPEEQQKILAQMKQDIEEKMKREANASLHGSVDYRV